MKKLILAVSACLSLLSCKEKGPFIDFGARQFIDTSYTTTVETPEPHRVLVEEFTGASCPNCPAARQKLADLSNANPGRVLVVAIHPFGLPQGAPVHNVGKYDFRTQKGTDLLTTIYPDVVGIPVAGIDRVPVNGKLQLLSNVWPSAINTRLLFNPPVNLTLTSTFTESTRTASIKLRIAYTQPVDFGHSVTMAIIEDDLVDAQEKPDSIVTYTFKHVFRDFVTPVSGQNIQAEVATKPAGYVYEATFKYPVSDAWKPENCHVVAYVHRNDPTNREILQAVETDLK